MTSSSDDVGDRFDRGVRHFDRGEWFEAHEEWEEEWRTLRGDDRLLLQALIQSAVALHHFDRGNEIGARHLRDAALAKFSLLPSSARGIDLETFVDDVLRRLRPLSEAGAEPGPRPVIRRVGGP